MANEMWLVSAKDVDFYAAQHFSFDIYTAVTTAVRGVPRVDARPVVHGRWEERYVPNGKYVAWDGFYCSACDNKAAKSPYCPNCGATMDGGDGDGNK